MRVDRIKVGGGILAGIAWLALLSAVNLAAASTHEEQFLEGLRARRLFRLAEAYCNERLQDPSLTETRRAELVVELSRNLAEHALNSTGTERSRLWKEARDVAERFAREFPNHPRLLLVRIQGALAALAEGELLRQEMEVNGGSEELRTAAQGALRGTIVQLKQLEEETAAALRRTRPGQLEPGQLSIAELTTLQNNLRYQLARAFRNQALCYAASSLDRINALTQAAELLEPLARLPLDDPLGWSSRLDQLICSRLAGSDEQAERQLAEFPSDNRPATVEARLLAERIRLAIDQRQLDAALKLAGEAGQRSGAPVATLDFARLEAYVAAWRHSGKQQKSADAQRWEQATTDQIRRIGELHGPYWLGQGEALLAASLTDLPGFEGPAGLQRAAASYYRGGQFDQALAAYDRAVEQATAKGLTEQAFDLAYTAAAIEHERKHHRQAIDRYRRLAMQMPEHPKAGEAHLLAIFNAAQLAQQQTPPVLDEYVQLLDEHLTQWSDATTAAQVRWWRGRLYEQQRAWQQAISLYQAIPTDHDQYVAAVEASVNCYLQWLAELRAAGKGNEKLARQAAEYFEGLIVRPGGKLPAASSRVAQIATIAAGRILIQEVSDGALRAGQLLQAALQGATDAPDEWRSSARALLMAALAGQGQMAEAAGHLKELSSAAPHDLIDLLSHLSQLTEREPARRRELAELALQVSEQLVDRQPELSQAHRAEFERLRAEMLTAAGRSDAARAHWESLARQYPDDGQIQEQYAGALSAAQDVESQKAAVAQWSAVQRKSRPGTSRWFRAQLGLARGLVALDKKPQARAMIKLLEVTHPEMGGKELQTQFAEVLRQCQEPSPKQR